MRPARKALHLYLATLGVGVTLSFAAENSFDQSGTLDALDILQRHQRSISDNTAPITYCAPGPQEDVPNLPARDNCWDDTAVHRFITNANFSTPPDIVSRSEWGAMPYSDITYKQVTVRGVKKWVPNGRKEANPPPLVASGAGPTGIVIHHTDGPEKTYGIKSIQEDHMLNRSDKMSDIGYHFAIGYDHSRAKWVVYEGRQKRTEVTPEGLKRVLAQGAHAKYRNPNRIGIVLMGKYDSSGQAAGPMNPNPPKNEGEKRPPPEAVQLLGQLIQSLMTEFPTIHDISGHGSGFHYATPGTGDALGFDQNLLKKANVAAPDHPDLAAAAAKAPIFSVPENTPKSKLSGASRYSRCPGDHVFQVIESMRTRFLGAGKGFTVSEAVKNGVPGPACQIQQAQAAALTPTDEEGSP